MEIFPHSIEYHCIIKENFALGELKCHRCQVIVSCLQRQSYGRVHKRPGKTKIRVIFLMERVKYIMTCNGHFHAHADTQTDAHVLFPKSLMRREREKEEALFSDSSPSRSIIMSPRRKGVFYSPLMVAGLAGGWSVSMWVASRDHKVACRFSGGAAHLDHE